MDLPPELDVPERGKDSLEKDAQTQREQTALSALYMSEAQIPGCPGEISTTIPDEEVDREVRMMLTGPDIDAVLWTDTPPPPGSSVADLVGQLANVGGGQGMALDGFSTQDNMMINGQTQTPSLDTLLEGLSAERLQQITQALATSTASMYVSPPTGPASSQYGHGHAHGHAPAHDPNTNGNLNGTGNLHWQTQNDSDADIRDRRWEDSWDRGFGRGRGRGRGGRGRGLGDSFRNIKRKPCTFFAAGRRASDSKSSLQASKLMANFLSPFPDASLAINVISATIL